MKVERLNEDSLLITLGDCIDETLLPRITAIATQLRQQWGAALVELVPAYTTLLVVFDPWLADADMLTASIRRYDHQASTRPCEERTVELPVYYDSSVAPDLEDVARRCQMDIAGIIALHSQSTYRVFAIGFSPGFAFMGTLHPALSLPRLATPRAQVPAGSVAIANQQTAIYPQSTPGGWHIIGRSPAQLFSADRLSRLQVGDQVRFQPVDRATYLALGGLA
ncbi:MAG: 5-oxoprolinase subunit PxpB [Marinobacter sp.]|nr:5-oxoprolinase subunit PxpB [Marinobacter sp.]